MSEEPRGEPPASSRPWSTIAAKPAHSGVARLVPPICTHGVGLGRSNGSYTATPVFGSASAATSGLVRWPFLPAKPSFCWYGGIEDAALDPPPLPLQPVSLAHLPLASMDRLVPPTDTTSGDADG